MKFQINENFSHFDSLKTKVSSFLPKYRNFKKYYLFTKKRFVFWEYTSKRICKIIFGSYRPVALIDVGSEHNSNLALFWTFYFSSACRGKWSWPTSKIFCPRSGIDHVYSHKKFCRQSMNIRHRLWVLFT